ncbi:MAG: hypothetical protein N4A53_07165 [Pelagimonas sp.]|jgi:hypothetical protein|nr:hypothetical protein [Pelagimonas sp.]
MQNNELGGDQSQQHILSFLDERIESCESKRKRNQLFMNSLKLIRVVSGVLAVLFVALLAADGFKEETKFILNLAALVCTSLTALGSELASAFGFEKRFASNVWTAGQLRSIKSKFKLELTLLEPNKSLDYRKWHNDIVEILERQSVKFNANFDKAHKSK